jgi:hypothetical protein
MQCVPKTEVVHVSFTFGRVLVKFIGTHAAYDRIDPETVTWRKKIRPLRSEADYDAALNEIEQYIENEPKPGTPEADRGNGRLCPSRSWLPAWLAPARIRHPHQEASPHDENGLEAAPRVGHSGRGANRAAANARTKVRGVSAWAKEEAPAAFGVDSVFRSGARRDSNS